PSSLARIIKADKGTRTEALLKPCCIISSSGMMTGGPSVWYAKQLIDNHKNAILITGYQDEESPGRRLLEMETGKSVKIGDEEFLLGCRVERYHLSAHADQGQLCQWISYIKPKSIILVHGDPSSVQTLRTKLADKYIVWNPKTGETVMPLGKPEWMTEKLNFVMKGKDIKYKGKMEFLDKEIVIKIDKSIEDDPLWQQYYANYKEIELKWHGTRLLMRGSGEQ
ncbi:MAG: MBL fold metallo-hydrolase RNA specificity domain-containing protein, partial [Candidatus Eremiobacterota bacterium]